MKYWKDAEMMIPRVHSLAMATVDADGSPHVTPIGSLFHRRGRQSASTLRSSPATCGRTWTATGGSPYSYSAAA